MKNPNSYTPEQRRLGGLNRPRRDESFEEVLSRFKSDRKGLYTPRKPIQHIE
jgi:hypothetical protein